MSQEEFDKLLGQHMRHAAGKRYVPPKIPSMTAAPTNNAYKKGCSRDLVAFGRTQSLGAWARESGKARDTLNRRMDGGMTLEEAITKPSTRGGTGKKIPAASGDRVADVPRRITSALP